MKHLRLIGYELRRLLRQPLTWGVLGLMLAICASTITGLLQMFLQENNFVWLVNYNQTETDRNFVEPLVNALIPCGLGMVLLLSVQLENAKKKQCTNHRIQYNRPRWTIRTSIG